MPEVFEVNQTTLTVNYPGKLPQHGLVCCHCGRTGVDVEMFTAYVGGQGTVHRPECVNKPACWKRMGW